MYDQIISLNILQNKLLGRSKNFRCSRSFKQT